MKSYGLLTTLMVLAKVNDKIELVEKILTELIRQKWPDRDAEKAVGNYMAENIWQLGYKNGLR